MQRHLSLAILTALTSATTAAASPYIQYSGEVNLVLGGLSSTPAVTVDFDGAGAPDIKVESKLIPAQTGAATYVTSYDPVFVGSGGAITPLNLGDVVSANHSGLSFYENIFTGFDFTEAPNDAGIPLGPYFSETTPQEYYWGFSFAGDTIGVIPGWMRVTINPLVIDRDNETLSGGEIILREWAFDRASNTIRVGQIPEPTALLQVTLAAGSLAVARVSRASRRR